MENNLSELAGPLQIHYGYVNAILNRREGDVDFGYSEPLNEFDYSAGEIFLHGINGLHRAIKTQYNPETNFNDHNVARLEVSSLKEELMELYSNAISEFVKLLNGISIDDKHSSIKSPISGNETTLLNWFNTCVMHTIHHIGQALRIHGMVLKKKSNRTFERIQTASYQIIQ